MLMAFTASTRTTVPSTRSAAPRPPLPLNDVCQAASTLGWPRPLRRSQNPPAAGVRGSRKQEEIEALKELLSALPSMQRTWQVEPEKEVVPEKEIYRSCHQSPRCCECIGDAASSMKEVHVVAPSPSTAMSVLVDAIQQRNGSTCRYMTWLVCEYQEYLRVESSYDTVSCL